MRTDGGPDEAAAALAAGPRSSLRIADWVHALPIVRALVDAHLERLVIEAAGVAEEAVFVVGLARRGSGLDELERLFEGLTTKVDAIAGKLDAPPQG